MLQLDIKGLIRPNKLYRKQRDINPKESFTIVKHDIEHFGIFGCPVYFHVPKEKRSKIDPSGRKGTFVGYSEYLKAYRIYILG
jgi:hypothetical protein